MVEKHRACENLPLAGQTVVVTRMAQQAASLTERLRAAGADVLEAPTIALQTVDDDPRADAALSHLDKYDWLVVTSTNGVDATFDRLTALGFSASHLADIKIAVVGKVTAARLASHGVEADVMPEKAVGDRLAAAMAVHGIKGERVLLLRADIAGPQLPDALTAAGASCDDFPIYRTVRPDALPNEFIEQLQAGAIDWVTLTSPSSFENLRSLLPAALDAQLRKVRLASIGPVTTAAIEAAGFDVAVEAEPYDVVGMVDAMAAAVR